MQCLVHSRVCIKDADTLDTYAMSWTFKSNEYLDVLTSHGVDWWGLHRYGLSHLCHGKIWFASLDTFGVCADSCGMSSYCLHNYMTRDSRLMSWTLMAFRLSELERRSEMSKNMVVRTFYVSTWQVGSAAWFVLQHLIGFAIWHVLNVVCFVCLFFFVHFGLAGTVSEWSW